MKAFSAVITEVFVWPPESKTAEYMAKGIYFNGVENDKRNGTGRCFNWILSNGHNSEQRDDECPTDFIHVMPQDAHLRIKKVEVYYLGFIAGFKFFAKNKELIWNIGNTD